jgi:tetratricopeptide (TPR) repeat protein
MQKNTLMFVIVALAAGFAGGFWLANSLNRSAMNSGGPIKASAPASNTALANSNRSQPNDDLTADEIKAKIAEADKNAGDFQYQKDLGVALYRYAATKEDVDLLNESTRILDRAMSLNPQDSDVLVADGNAHFDIGFAKKDAAQYKKARDVYTSALQVKPNDADVATDLGLTYFLQEPPDYVKAAAQMQKVVDANPTHTRSLQFLVRVLTKQNKLAEADKALAKLKSIDPNYDAIPELSSDIEAARKGEAK